MEPRVRPPGYGGGPLIAPHLMLYNDADPAGGGHHFEHIQYLLDYWIANRPAGTLDVVIAAEFLQLYPRLARQIADGQSVGLRMVSLKRPGWPAKGAGQLLRRNWMAGRQLSEYVERLRPTCCLLMTFDHFQLSFVCGLRFDFPVRFAGIYFRPTFHYGSFGTSSAIGDRVRRLRQRALLALAMRNPHLATLFCLDPYSVTDLSRISPRVRALPLPDPVVPAMPKACGADLRAALGIERGRRVFLLFGDLSRRKGTIEVLKAVDRLSDESCARVCLVLAGRIPATDASGVLDYVARLRAARPLQIVVQNRFLEEAEVRRLYGLADVILVPYQKHAGNSGVLMRAAAAGVPVLGSNYGLVGQLIRRHRLGLAIDASSPPALADAIGRFLSENPSDFFDPARADALARRNDVEGFATTIFSSLIPNHRGPNRVLRSQRNQGVGHDGRFQHPA